MDDFQKWLEAAAAIKEDIEYLKHSLTPRDLEALETALAVYLKNARTGVAWPKPDDLYCIENRGPVIATGTVPDYKQLAC